MGYAGRNNIYEATIKRMVTQALEAQEQNFINAHAADTDEQLLTYLCRCAASLGHAPWPREMIGGSFIEQRFGSWKNALLKANCPIPAHRIIRQTLPGFKRNVQIRKSSIDKGKRRKSYVPSSGRQKRNSQSEDIRTPLLRCMAMK